MRVMVTCKRCGGTASRGIGLTTWSHGRKYAENHEATQRDADHAVDPADDERQENP